MYRMLLHVSLHAYQPPCQVELNAAPWQLTIDDDLFAARTIETEGQEKKVR